MVSRDSAERAAHPIERPRPLSALLPLQWLGALLVVFLILALYFKYLKIFGFSPHLLLMPVVGLGLLLWPRSPIQRAPIATAIRLNVWLLAFGLYAGAQDFLIGAPTVSAQNLLLASFAVGGTLVSAVLLLAAPRASWLTHKSMQAIYAVGVVSAALLLMQVFVSFQSFDIITFTNELALSDTGEVNEYINNAIAAQSRGRGLSDSVHVFAATSIMTLSFGLYLARRSSLALWTLPVVGLAILVNQSLTALSAFAFAWLLWSGLLGRGRNLLWRAGVLFLTVGVGMVLTQLLQDVFSEGMRGLMLYGAVDSMSSRIAAWDRALQMFVENPIFGIGGGNFKAFLHDYDGLFLMSSSFPEQEAHSIVFQTLSQWGAVGSALLGLHFLKAFRAILRLQGTMAAGLAVAFVGIMLKAMLGNEILLFHLFFLSCVILTLEAEGRALNRLSLPSAQFLRAAPA